MSPLACSLFALAAMLATAHSFCATKNIGVRTAVPINFQRVGFQPPGARIMVDPIYCTPPLQVVGEDITACNNDSYGPAPVIDGPAPGTWSPFDVKCDVYGCPRGGYVDVVQYCGVPYNPPK